MVIRMMLRKLLHAADGLEVVGSASNGQDALKQVEELKPDCVTMDIEMPIMTGIEAVEKLVPQYPKLKIVMVSSLTSFGAKESIKALSLGAADFICKPDGSHGTKGFDGDFIKQLVYKIKSVCGDMKAVNPLIPPPKPKPPTTGMPAVVVAKKTMPSLSRPPRRVAVIAIAVSTGGPAALEKLIPQLPKNFACPIVITQHMPPLFTKQLAERLDRNSALQVCEAEHDMPLEKGTVYFAPGGSHLICKRHQGQLVAQLDAETPPENGCRPAADVMLRSFVDETAGQFVGVVLTGMGQDGLIGCQKLRKAGGWVIAQDEATSVVWGMPGVVSKKGVSHEVLPLEKIAPRLKEILTFSTIGMKVK